MTIEFSLAPDPDALLNRLPSDHLPDYELLEEFETCVQFNAYDHVAMYPPKKELPLELKSPSKSNGTRIDNDDDVWQYNDTRDRMFDYSIFDEYVSEHLEELLQLSGHAAPITNKRNSEAATTNTKVRHNGNEENDDENHDTISTHVLYDMIDTIESCDAPLSMVDLGPFHNNSDWPGMIPEVTYTVMTYLTDAKSMCTMSLVNKSWLRYVNQLAKEQFMKRWSNRASYHYVHEQIIRLNTTNRYTTSGYGSGRSKNSKLKNNWITEYRDQDTRDQSLTQGYCLPLNDDHLTLQFLISKRMVGAPYPLCFLTSGGKVLSSGYGSVRAFSSKQLKDIHDALQHIELSDVVRNWKHLPVPRSHKELEKTLNHIRLLRLFLQHAVENSPQHGLLVGIHR